jgi:xylulokinase
MGKPCVLGIDIGTSSCKVAAVDAQGGLLGVESSPYPIRSRRPGWSEQDVREWLPAVERATACLLGQGVVSPSQVAGLALSSAAHIAVLLDGEGESLREAILWNDQRSEREAAELVETMGDALFARTCNQASPTWSLPQLLWIRRHEPEVWGRVRRLCLSKDYVIRQLTGRWCTDPATAVSALLFDVRTGRWSGELCGRLGLPVEALPEVGEMTEPAGTLLPSAAERLGLPRGLPVIRGCLDSVAESYSAGARRPGDCVIRLGTGGGVQLLRPGPAGHPKLLSYPYPVSPLWLSQAGTNACGASLEWASRALGGPTALSPEGLSRLAAQASPGADGVLFHPYLLGERCPHWDGALRGSFVGLSLGHGPEQLARAVLEGVAYSQRDAASLFEGGERPLPIGTMTVVGGGARSELLTRILCDLFGREMRVDPEADSAHGAALLALRALGVAAEAGGPAAPRGRLLRPDPAASARYAEGFAAYRAVHRSLRGYYHGAVDG